MRAAALALLLLMLLPSVAAADWYGELPSLMIPADAAHSFTHCPVIIGKTVKCTNATRRQSLGPHRAMHNCEYGLAPEPDPPSETPYGATFRVYAASHGYSTQAISGVCAPIDWAGFRWWPACIGQQMSSPQGWIAGDASCHYPDDGKEPLP